MELRTRNINTAFRELVGGIARGRPGFIYPGKGRPPIGIHTVTTSSRQGQVYVVDEPVTIYYDKPLERVLFNQARDANPFFHLYESLWMLAGREDATSLGFYNSKIGPLASDDWDERTRSGRLNGAYGWRWRKTQGPLVVRPPAFIRYGIDQLEGLVEHLKAFPDSRRAVLQMWNIERDFLKIGMTRKVECENCGGEGFVDSLTDPCPLCLGEKKVPDRGGSKDVCCNLSVLFSLRDQVVAERNHPKFHMKASVKFLDMTVLNRSNDLILGTLGSDYVTFSFLQEYMAAKLGVQVGRYRHFSNNLHVYEWNWKPEEWLADYDGVEYGYQRPFSNYKVVPLVQDIKTFEEELPQFVEHYESDNLEKDDGDRKLDPFRTWKEPFFEKVAAPMFNAFQSYKRKGATTMIWTQRIEADDWKIAAQQWIEKRLNKRS